MTCSHCGNEVTEAPNIFGEVRVYHKIASPENEGYERFINACPKEGN